MRTGGEVLYSVLFCCWKRVVGLRNVKPGSART